MKPSIFVITLLILGLFTFSSCEKQEVQPISVDVEFEVQVLDKDYSTLPIAGAKPYLFAVKYVNGQDEKNPFQWRPTTDADGWVVVSFGYNLNSEKDFIYMDASLDDYNTIVNNNQERFQDARITYQEAKAAAGGNTHVVITKTLFLYQ